MAAVVEGFQLSPQQKRVWTRLELDGAGAFMVQGVARLGELDGGRVRAALDSLAERYEILRTVFQRVPGMDEPLQVIADTGSVAWSESAGVQDLAAHCELLRGQGFDLAAGPVLRADLVRLASGERWLVLGLPALCCDSHGLRVLWSHLGEALADALPVDDDELQYADLAEWQNDLLHAEETVAGRDYWRALKVQAGEPAASPWRRQDVDPTPFAPRRFVLEEPVELGPDPDTSSFFPPSFFLACWQVALLRRGFGAGVLGYVADGRKFAELEGALGPLARTVPVPPMPAAAGTFAAVETAARQAIEDAVRFQEAFTWELVDGDHPEERYLPIAFRVADGNAPAAGPLAVDPAAEHSVSERFEIELCCREVEGGWRLEISYDPRRYAAEPIRYLAESLRTLAAAAARAPETPLTALPVLGETEERRLAAELVAVPNPAGVAAETVTELFAEAVLAAPQQLALSDGTGELTYGELAARSRRLARYLRALGAGAETVVALVAARRAETVVGLLAILEAGAAYLPLDPALPAARRDYMLAAAGVRLVVGCELPPLPASVRGVDLAAAAEAIAAQEASPLDLAVDPRHLAYVLFTSGSTGLAKGVAVEHRQITAYVRAIGERLELAPGTFATVSSLAADLGNTMIFPALCGGGSLLVVPDSCLGDGGALAELFAARGVDHLKIVPGHLAALLETPGAERLLPRARLVCGGEAFPPDLLARVAALAPALAVFNHYGPTETTVGVAAGPMMNGRPVTLGSPLAGCRLYLSDASFAPVPLGVAGEVLIGGGQVARGYLGRAAATAERFVPDPFSERPGERLYRTGDRGRLGIAPGLEFLGRVDHQVKVRGYRVELGEIESVLAVHADVRRAVAVLRQEAGPQELVAYAELAEGATSGLASLHEHLRDRLPEHMVPGEVVVVDQWPLTANGKLDRAALPAPKRSEGASALRPRTPVEELVIELWRGLLGREQIAPTDDFFALGGHSLLAMQLTARLRKVFGVEFAIDRVFEAPTPRQLAREVELATSAGAGREVPPLVRRQTSGPAPLSFAQERHWFLQQLDPESPLYNIRGALRVTGPLDVAVLADSFRQILVRHEVLRTAFPGREAGPVQVVLPEVPLSVPVIDLRDVGESVREAQAMELATALGLVPFSLDRPPLLRVEALRLDAAEHILVLTFHHIIADRWTLSLLIAELTAIYPALLAGRPSPLPELAVQYADFAYWQRAWLRGDVIDRQLEWWRLELADAPPVLELPFARRRPPRLSGRSGRLPFTLGAELGAELKRLGRQHGATLFQTLLALFQLLLHGLSGARDVVVGSPVAGRGMAETEGLVGCFINALALRARFGDDPSFVELLARVRSTLLGAYAHQDLPFERLVQELNPERRAGAAPVFQAVFNYADTPVEALDFAGLTLTPLRPESIFDAKYDLILAMFDSPDGLRSFLIYSLDLFDQAAMVRMAEQLERLAARVVARPEARASALAAALRDDEHRARIESAQKLREERQKTLAGARRAAVR